MDQSVQDALDQALKWLDLLSTSVSEGNFTKLALSRTLTHLRELTVAADEAARVKHLASTNGYEDTCGNLDLLGEVSTRLAESIESTPVWQIYSDAFPKMLARGRDNILDRASRLKQEQD